MSRCRTQGPGRNPAACGGVRSMDLPRPERLNQETQDRSPCCLCSAPKRRGVKHLEAERDFHQPASPRTEPGRKPEARLSPTGAGGKLGPERWGLLRGGCSSYRHTLRMLGQTHELPHPGRFLLPEFQGLIGKRKYKIGRGVCFCLLTRHESPLPHCLQLGPASGTSSEGP